MVDYILHLDELEKATTKENFISCCNTVYNNHRVVQIPCPVDYDAISHPGAVKSVSSFLTKEMDLKLRGTIMGVIAILSRNKENEDLFRELNVFKFLEECFEKYSESRRMKKNILWAFCNLPNIDKNEAIKWIERVMKILKENKNHLRLNLYGCTALVEQVNSTGRFQCKEAVSVILETMKNFSEIEHIQVYCPWGIRKFSKKGEPPAPEIIAQIFESLKLNKTSSLIQWQGLKTLDFFVDHTEINKDWIELVMMALKTHRETPKVVLQAFLILYSCAQQLIFTNKDICFIFNVLAQYKDNEDILVPGIGILCGITEHALLYLLDPVKKMKKIVTLEIINFIMDVMKMYKENIDVQLNGCNLLKNVVCEDVLQLSTRREVIETVYEAVATNSDNPWLQETALGAIACFVNDAMVTGTEIQRALSFVIRAMELHCNVDYVLDACFHVIYILCTFTPWRRFEIALAPKVLEYIISIMQDNKNVQYNGIVALNTLIRCDVAEDIKRVQKDIYPKFVQLGGIECFIRAENDAIVGGTALDLFAHNMSFLAGYEEKIASFASKYDFKTGSCEFGTKIGTRYSEMLGLSNSRFVPAILSLETLAAKVIACNPELFPNPNTLPLPEMVTDKIDVIIKTIHWYNHQVKK